MFELKLNEKNEIASFQLLEVEFKKLRQEGSLEDSRESNSEWMRDRRVVGLWDFEDDCVTDNGEYTVQIICKCQLWSSNKMFSIISNNLCWMVEVVALEPFVQGSTGLWYLWFVQKFIIFGLKFPVDFYHKSPIS